MIKPWKRLPLEVVSLSGTPCEVAHELGAMRHTQIEKRILAWDETLARLYRGRRDKLKRLEKSFLREAIKQAPHYVEEIRAMAQGAGVSFTDLFRLNCTELNAFAEKCTTLILPVKTRDGQRIFIAHNEDWDPRRNDVFVLKVRLPQCSYVILTYDGYLPGLSCGFNSWGLYHAVNYLRPKDMRVGLPRIFITRHLVTATDVADCLAWIHKSRRAFGQSIHLAEGERYTGLELTARDVQLRQVLLPVAHANHYLTRRFKTVAAKASPSSRIRQQTAEKILREISGRQAPPWTLPQAKKIAARVLSDRSTHPYCLWREADVPEEESATVACAMMVTGESELSIYRRSPESKRPLRIELP